MASKTENPGAQGELTESEVGDAASLLTPSRTIPSYLRSCAR